MAQAKILVTRRWPDTVERRLADTYAATLNASDAPLSAAALRAAAAECDALCPTVSDQITAEVLGDNPKLKLIANYGVGFSHIDIEACKRLGIAVTNTPDVLTDATAEIALLLILMAARRGGEAERHIRAGAWTGWRPTQFLGQEVTGARLGVIGFGRIGQAVAAKAKGIGMAILYHSHRRAAPDIEASFDATWCEGLDELLAQSDFVTLHCPGGAETRHLIDARRLALMKPSAFLINTARGEVIDEAALIAALQAGHIAGAGLDVYEEEPRVPPALTALENVVLLPHLGSATVKTRTAMGMRVADNLDAFFASREPPDRIA
jgi:lactate dehydrogenase-like 2-hydroxyacid dehydrogenase